MRKISKTISPSAYGNTCAALLALSGVLCVSVALKAQTAQTQKQKDAPITVRFTDIRKSAGITFLQDSTQTEEKYYLETMGTGVAWIDYDQDGLMDLFLCSLAPRTLTNRPPSALRSLSQQRRRHFH